MFIRGGTAVLFWQDLWTWVFCSAWTHPRFSPLQETKPYQSRLSWQIHKIGNSFFLFQWLQLNNSYNCSRNLITWISMHKWMISGLIFGDLQFSLQKRHTLISWCATQPLQFSSGCGSQIKVQNKHKFFFWLLLRDRLNTRNLSRRKNMFLECYSCVPCVEEMEESQQQHMFFDYPFSQAWWLFW